MSLTQRCKFCNRALFTTTLTCTTFDWSFSRVNGEWWMSETWLWHFVKTFRTKTRDSRFLLASKQNKTRKLTNWWNCAKRYADIINQPLHHKHRPNQVSVHTVSAPRWMIVWRFGNLQSFGQFIVEKPVKCKTHLQDDELPEMAYCYGTVGEHYDIAVPKSGGGTNSIGAPTVNSWDDTPPTHPPTPCFTPIVLVNFVSLFLYNIH